MKIKCPKCNEENYFATTSAQAIDATTGITFTPAKNCLLGAVEVGEGIAAFARLLDVASNELGPLKTMHVLKKITTDENGAITAFLITTIKPERNNP
jgi:hypothetical protein